MSLFQKYNLDALRLTPGFQAELKSAAEGTIVGLASPFGGTPDRHGDIVQHGAFTKTIADHRSEGTMPAMLWSHRIDEPIGHWTELKEDAKGLIATGAFNLKTERGREAFEHVKGGDAIGLSIGFLLPEGGRKYNGDGSFTITKVELVEISVVAIPAAPRARIASVKSLTSKSELIDLLREAGLAKTAAARLAAGGWPALAGGDHQKALDLAAQIERATAQLRIA